MTNNPIGLAAKFISPLWSHHWSYDARRAKSSDNTDVPVSTRREMLKIAIRVLLTWRPTMVGLSSMLMLESCGGDGPSGESAPAGLSYTSSLQGSVGAAITPIAPSVSGTVTNYSVTPSLPSGLGLNASTGVISGTPSSVSTQAHYTITASNSAGGTSFTIVLTVVGNAMITSVSSTTPTALTPLTLNMTGLDFTSAFTVTLNTATNVSVALPVISAQSTAGTVVVAVPFYFDPNQLITTAFTATLSVTQSNVTSNVITLNIADLPAVIGYTRGGLSSNFLANSAMTYAATANGLQAVQALSPSNSNSSAAVTFANKYVTSTLLMKNDIDTLTSNTASQLTVGTAADGTTVVLDQSSLSLMDRIINLHLQNIASAVGSASPSQIRHAKAQARPQDLAGIITGLGISSNIIAFNNAKTAFVNSEDGIDEFIALGQGVGAALGIIGAIPGLGEFGGAAKIASATVGAAYGLLACASDLGSCIGYSLAASDAAAQGNQSGFAATQAQLAQAEKNLTTDILGTVVSVVDLGANGIGGVSGEALNVLKSATEGEAPGVVIKGVELFNNFLTDAVQDDGANLNNYLDQIGVSNQEIPPTANSFFVAAGNTISFSTSQSIYPLTGTQLADPATGDAFNGLAGLDSNYELTVPVNAPGIDYSNLQLTPYDPLSGSEGIGGTVDLSGAGDSDIVTLPAITSAGLNGGVSTCVDPPGEFICSAH